VGITVNLKASLRTRKNILFLLGVEILFICPQHSGSTDYDNFEGLYCLRLQNQETLFHGPILVVLWSQKFFLAMLFLVRFLREGLSDCCKAQCEATKQKDTQRA